MTVALKLARPRHELELLRRARNLRWTLELESVARGLRPAGLITASDSQIGWLLQQVRARGLFMDLAYRSERFRGYSHLVKPPKVGQENNISFAYSHDPKLARKLADAILAGDHQSSAELLGYPPCCAKVFMSRWDQGWFDQVVPWLEPLAEGGKASLLSAPLFRYFGLSFVFHLPCSPSCRASRDIGLAHWMLLEELDVELADWLTNLTWVQVDVDEDGLMQLETELFSCVCATTPISKPLSTRIELIL